MTVRIAVFAALAAIIAVFVAVRLGPQTKASLRNPGVMRTRIVDFVGSESQTGESKTEKEAERRFQNPVRSADAEESGSTDAQVGATGADERIGASKGVEAGNREVARFHAETDCWVRERPVEVEDIRQFARAFNAVPHVRKKECIRRALNLIPDANIALLAGVLLDKSQPTEVVREVFTDILNRSDEVKKPILQEVFKDKTHPCCSDAEWIFEVTGEKPE